VIIVAKDQPFQVILGTFYVYVYVTLSVGGVHSDRARCAVAKNLEIGE